MRHVFPLQTTYSNLVDYLLQVLIYFQEQRKRKHQYLLLWTYKNIVDYFLQILAHFQKKKKKKKKKKKENRNGSINLCYKIYLFVFWLISSNKCFSASLTLHQPGE